jgi:hemin uptake protein HemP
MDKLAQASFANTGILPEESAIYKPAVARLSCLALFAGAKELVIDHGGQEYRLRQTSQGKLILTK